MPVDTHHMTVQILRSRLRRNPLIDRGTGLVSKLEVPCMVDCDRNAVMRAGTVNSVLSPRQSRLSKRLAAFKRHNRAVVGVPIGLDETLYRHVGGDSARRHKRAVVTEGQER